MLWQLGKHLPQSLISAPVQPIIHRIDNVTTSSAIVWWSTGATKNIARISLSYNDSDTSSLLTLNMSDVLSRSYNVSNLQPGHNYCFRVTVQSYDKSNQSVESCQRTTNQSSTAYQVSSNAPTPSNLATGANPATTINVAATSNLLATTNPLASTKLATTTNPAVTTMNAATTINLPATTNPAATTTLRQPHTSLLPQI